MVGTGGRIRNPKNLDAHRPAFIDLLPKRETMGGILLFGAEEWSTDMRPILPIILASIAAASCAHQARHVGAEQKCGKARTATESALQLLDKKGLAAEYLPDRSRQTDEGASWNVWILRREFGFPGEALIKVRKSDCLAAWQPLK